MTRPDLNLIRIALIACLLMPGNAKAQDSLMTHIYYTLTAEAAVGTGDYTAFQLAANRHHVLSTRQNTGYLRGVLNVSHQFSKDLTLSGAVDVIGSIHADHKTYLQQCYANLTWKSLFIEAGSREELPVLRDPLLSSGAFIKGTNAKPLPQIHLGTDGFWTVPFTNDWLQVNFDFGYGRFVDNGYRENAFRAGEAINMAYATDIYYHQKHLYFRTNPDKPVFVTAGIEHVAQFGGTGYLVENGTLTSKKKPTNLKAFWNVILPLGDSNYYENEALEDWVYGNHIGSMTVQVGWNINRDHLLQAYLDNPFEDGSGMRKGNGWDGLWGVQYTNKAEGRQWVRGAVVEYLQTTNQSGPLHWDSSDYPKPIRNQITDFVTGNDNYYNHGFYGSYTNYGMTPGHPLVASPIYNKDGNNCFTDNRIKAWHVGINGELTDRLAYLAKASYREGMGTYLKPIYPKRHSFDAMLQGLYTTGTWQFSAAYAFNQGNIFGNGSTFNLKISYHGQIL